MTTRHHNTRILFLAILCLLIISAVLLSARPKEVPQTQEVVPTPPPTASPSATPTPTPLSFDDMNKLYGPCAKLPTIFYHHIEDLDVANKAGYKALTVATTTFAKHMQYLADKKYSVVSAQDLINFFDSGTPLPTKPILITFDDGYEDFYTNAYPILKAHNFPAIMFVPTGLANVPVYMTWDQIKEASQNKILMANHTWSHKNMQSSAKVDANEITTADTQLADHGLNSPRTFAYPYGLVSSAAKKTLSSLNYSLAFTTAHGSTLCKKQRLELPRIRIGGGNLSSYGL